MADFSAFRGALNGFNRSDVTNYIESLCEEHRNALRQAKTEAETLRGECASLREKLDAAQQEKQELSEQVEVLTALLEEACTPKEEPAPEAPEAEEEPDYVQMELEAYRRAEATERTAAERASKLRAKLSELLDMTAGRYEEAGREIHALTSDLSANLQRLDETLSELNSVFDSAVEDFDTLREEEEPYSD